MRHATAHASPDIHPIAAAGGSPDGAVFDPAYLAVQPDPDASLSSSDTVYNNLDLMRMVANTPVPTDHTDFTPEVAASVIANDRLLLAEALREIDRLSQTVFDHASPMPAGLSAAFLERMGARREASYIAKLFPEDGGMWTIFAQNEYAIALTPDRATAIALVHQLSGQPQPEAQPTEPQPEPVTPTEPEAQPDPEDTDPDGTEEAEDDEDMGSELTDPDGSLSPSEPSNPAPAEPSS